MTDPVGERFAASGFDLVALEGMADLAGLGVAEFVKQGVDLGLDLGELALELRPYVAHVYFEETPGRHVGYPLDFPPHNQSSAHMTPSYDALLDYEAELAAEAAEKVFAFELDQGLNADVTALACRFDVSTEDFITQSLFFRVKWALTQPHLGRIAVDDGSETGLILVSKELMLSDEASD
jgi:hypothetical protein